MAYTSSYEMAAQPLGKQIARLFHGLALGLAAMAERQSRSGEIAQLSALSASELAARGLTRDRIAGHVFADRFCF